MALDRITRALLDDFVKSEGLDQLDDSDAFERLAAFSVISREHPETFNVEETATGGGTDTGIDGLAILVNGSLITSVEEVEDLVESNGYLEATFLFVQGKTSPSFDAGEIGNFCTGVRDFFAEEPALPRNEQISERREYSGGDLREQREVPTGQSALPALLRHHRQVAG